MEVCVDNVLSFINAVEAGASRIELCSSLAEGGLTPSLGFFRQVQKINIHEVPIHILLRPRGGDFYYRTEEIEIMKEDASIFAENGANGLVLGMYTMQIYGKFNLPSFLGCLDKEAQVDVESTKRILQGLPANMSLTFHRAFDVSQDPWKAAECIQSLGFHRILSSGQEKSAALGIPLLKKLQSKYTDLIFMPGGGINEGNLKDILEGTSVKEFHASARSMQNSLMTHQNAKCKMGSDSTEYSIQVTDQTKVRKLIQIYTEYISNST